MRKILVFFVNGIFLPPSIGKNACDGIGGTVKRATARASIQRVTNRQILTLIVIDMFNFRTRELTKNIKFYFNTSHDVEKTSAN